MNRNLTAIFVTLLCVFSQNEFSSVCAQTDKTISSHDEHFVLNVLPTLIQKCFVCHGKNGKVKGELNLMSLQGMLEGGESGSPAIDIGAPESSLLVEAIRWDGLEMPPKENDRLTAGQIADVEKWIRNGATWPSEELQAEIKNLKAGNADGEVVVTSGGLSDEWTNRRYKSKDLWAFRPVKKPDQPTGGYGVDAFVDRKIAATAVSPAPIATPRELIRRASYDLTGLPPTPSEIDEFKIAFNKDQQAAWKSLIERLLASPHYGERWGQHWLDVVRYADTAGFSNDFELSNAWRYRDYVIRSFNKDLPYNQFVIQQIAGDELWQHSEKSSSSITVDKNESLIATGFLRMGPWEHTGMIPEKLNRQNYLDDLVNGIGQAFLSTPLRCCKCHDHKFDPIPTRDYYRIYAALKRTQPAEMKADFLEEENRNLFETQKQHVKTLLKFASEKYDKLDTKRETAAKAWYREQGIEDKYIPWKERRLEHVKGPKPPRNYGLTPEDEGRLKVRRQDKRIWTRRLERFQPLIQSVYNGPDLLQHSRSLRPPTDETKKKRKPETPEEYFIYTGGDIYSESETVTPGVLSCVGLKTNSATPEDKFALDFNSDQRRLELARWIANSQNGLSTRSIVNRVWHYHFGKGIAGNPNNLGGTGAKPTHPELLDWLTFQFIENDWSIKSLHRIIMNSKAYMRSTQHPDLASLRTTDPSNSLLAVFTPRRLSAEEYRDTLLLVSGELNKEIGGLPVRQEINMEVALSPRMIQFSISPAYQPERLAKDRNRRSIYAYRVRGMRDPFMEVLDQPNPNESCELRDSASTAPQVFSMMNGDYVIKRSIAFAKCLSQQHDSIEEQILSGFMLATGTKISEKLQQELIQHFKDMVKYHRSVKPVAQPFPTSITRSLVEEFTGDAFEYEELLDIYSDYQPDDGPSDVSPEIRALADVCLLIFNSNQMMYVY